MCPALPTQRPEANPHASLAAPANHCCPPKLRPWPSSASHNHPSFKLFRAGSRPLFPCLPAITRSAAVRICLVGILIGYKINTTNSFKLELQIVLFAPINKDQSREVPLFIKLPEKGLTLHSDKETEAERTRICLRSQS